MPIGVFEYRRTIVTIDDYLPSVVQGWTAIQRRASQIGRSAEAETQGVAYVSGIGWRLRAYQMSYADVQELTDAQPGIYSVGGGLLNVAPGFEEYDSFAQTGLTGVSYGAGVQSSGSPFIQKRIGAADSWATNLDSDETAFPGPNPSENTGALDRVAISVDTHQPWDALMLSFVVPAGAIGSKAWVGCFYFTAPAGSDKAAQSDSGLLGTGQYALKLRADGRAKCYELLVNGTWKRRYEFNWSPSGSPNPYRACVMHIVSDAYLDGNDQWQGSRICFIPVASFGESYNRLLSTLVGIASSVVEYMAGAQAIYNIPRLTQQPATEGRIRLDLDRETRASFQLAKHIYPASGVLFDDVISLDQPVSSADEPLFLYWQALVPAGTTIVAELFDAATGSALALEAGPISSAQGIAYSRFTPTDGMRHVRVKITFTSNASRDRTPTLLEYAVYRSPVYQTESPVTPVELFHTEAGPGVTALSSRVVTSIDITPQETDPSGETATVVVDDITGELASLRSGTMRPIRIETEYNEAGDLATLFEGYVLTATGQVKKANPGQIYPSPNRRAFTLTCVGEWARLYEAIVQRRLTWVNPSTGQPFKVTDVIRIGLESIYPSSQVSVPDLPIRLFSTTGDAYVTEPGSRWGDVIRGLADDYLGAYILRDPSAGTRGKWRLLEQKAPPYNNLVYFEIDHPGAGKLVHVSAAYGTTTVGDQVVQHTFIDGEVSEWSERAEGNCVITYGAGVGTDAAKAGKQDAGLLTQIAIKTDSYNFLGLPDDHDFYPDGTSPEYIGRYAPIKVIDFKLTTQDAVDWKTRRVFDRACWARKYLQFHAPMVLVVDVDDAEQVRPRPLRYYDAVKVRNRDGDLEQFLVVSCAPSYTKDHIQMASYVLVRQGNIDSIATMPPPSSPFETLFKAISKMRGTGSHAPTQFSPQKSAEHLMSEAMGLPETVASPLQDLDPESPTFGQFLYMVDYDPLG